MIKNLKKDTLKWDDSLVPGNSIAFRSLPFDKAYQVDAGALCNLDFYQNATPITFTYFTHWLELDEFPPMNSEGLDKY